MSGPVESGENGGVAGVAQDTEADSEPPQSLPPVTQGESSGLGESLAEECPPAAKQPRLSGEGLALSLELPEAHGEPTEQAGGVPVDVALLIQDEGNVHTGG